MNLVNTLSKANRKIEDITRIYSGKENACRCGCAGRYFDRGTVGFTRAINKMKRDDFKPLKKGDVMWANYGRCISEGVVYGENYVDIPYNGDNDKCYCLYFDARVK